MSYRSLRGMFINEIFAKCFDKFHFQSFFVMQICPSDAIYRIEHMENGKKKGFEIHIELLLYFEFVFGKKYTQNINWIFAHRKFA